MSKQSWESWHGGYSEMAAETMPSTSETMAQPTQCHRRLSEQERELVLRYAHVDGMVSPDLIARAQAEANNAIEVEVADVASYNA